MNRTGLFISLGVGVIGGIVFGLFPQLDLTLARLFYDSGSKRFLLEPFGGPEYVRRALMWIAWAFAGPAIVAVVVKLFRPQKPLLVPRRAVIFLLTTVFLNALILPDIVLKDHWGRPRPTATREFNGTQAFRPWWDPRGTEHHYGSFFSAEASTAFWTYAPAALAPPSLRAVAFAGATLFGLTTGVLRMAFGAHYASDVLAAGVSAFLVTWLMHGFIYRWRNGSFSDRQLDRWPGGKIIKTRSEKLFW